MARVNVYVDGFNFYYGAVADQPYKWLDIEAFARTMLRPEDVINRIRYFSARVNSRRDGDAPTRQQTYFRALETLPCISMFFGQFLTSTVPAVRADGNGRIAVLKTEEKGSDVNLATYLILDAVDNDYDAALVISNDSDLATPIELVIRRFNRIVGVAMPVLNRNANGSPRVPSTKLRTVASFTRVIKDDAKWRSRLKQCQFPDELRDGAGTFRKPAKWCTPPY